MSRRSVIALVTLFLIAELFWYGGNALLNALVAMHGGGR